MIGRPVWTFLRLFDEQGSFFFVVVVTLKDEAVCGGGDSDESY